MDEQGREVVGEICDWNLLARPTQSKSFDENLKASSAQ